MILSTHVLAEVNALANRVLILHRGKIVHEQSIQAHDDTGHACLARFRQPVAAECFEQLCVAEPLNATGHEWRLHAWGEALPEHLLAQLIARGAVPLSWQPAQETLESVFVRVTTARDAPGAAT